VLSTLAAGKLDLSPLITHRFSINNGPEAYALIERDREPYLGIVLEYSGLAADKPKQCIKLRSRPQAGDIGVGCLGAGNFARMVLLPELRKVRAYRPEVLCSAGGLSASHCGKKLGFRVATAAEETVLGDDRVHAVFVVTRHDQHARQVLDAIRAGKHVFVEKPLCLTLDELLRIEEALHDQQQDPRILMVGYNRRFSPAARAVRDVFRAKGRCEKDSPPLTVSIRFNGGIIPADHWTQDECIGGGRIVGEACHAIDLATYLTRSVPVRVFAESIGGPNAPQVTDDQCFITLRHANGSVSSIGYLSGGDKAYGKERVEVVGDGKVAVIDDFRRAEACVAGRRKKLWRGRLDKGHQAELRVLAEAITGSEGAPIPWDELRAATVASILAVRSLREGVPLEIPQGASLHAPVSRAA